MPVLRDRRIDRLAIALLVATVATDIGWLVTRPELHSNALWVPLVAAVALHLALVERERRHPSLPRPLVLGAVGLVVLAAVVLPNYGSKDLYSYAFDGRMVAYHHTNPYFTSPSHFAHDPLLRSVSPAWRHGETVYGPLFTLVSAIGALVYGTSALGARLFFQGLDAVALLGGLVVLWRRQVRTDVLLFLGLAPAMVAVVNGGHNDLLAGVLLMVGAFLVQDRRVVAAGLVLAAAVLVKLLIVPGVACLLIALARNRGWRPMLRVSAVVGGVTALGYLCVGGPAALDPLTTTSSLISRASLWNGIDQALEINRGLEPSVALISHLATLSVAVFGTVFLLRIRRGGEPVAAAVGALLVLLLATQYTMPWYSALVLPTAALLVPRARALAYGQAVVLMLAYISPPGVVFADPRVFTWTLRAAPAVQAVLLLVVLAFWARAASPGSDPAPLSFTPEPAAL